MQGLDSNAQKPGGLGRAVLFVRLLTGGTLGMCAILWLASCEPSGNPTGPLGSRSSHAPNRLLVDDGCTDDTCDDEPDDWSGWGDEGASDWDSWDSFPENGNDSTAYADYHDDLYACVAGTNCTLRAPSSSDSTTIINVLTDLFNNNDPFCGQMGETMQQLFNTGNIQFFDNHIRARTAEGFGVLAGDAHPPNATGDPYAGQIHIFGGGRSSGAIAQTLRHEAAHFMGLPDGSPVNTTYPWSMNAEQAATYCTG
jgi:hypothetical protein